MKVLAPGSVLHPHRADLWGHDGTGGGRLPGELDSVILIPPNCEVFLFLFYDLDIFGFILYLVFGRIFWGFPHLLVQVTGLGQIAVTLIWAEAGLAATVFLNKMDVLGKK